MPRIWVALKQNLVAGVLVAMPAALTLWLVVAMWNWLNGPLYHFFEMFKNPQVDGGFGQGIVNWMVSYGIDLSPLLNVPGLGLLLVLSFLFCAGLAARSFLGKTVISISEQIVAKVPIIGSIYKALKQLLAAFFGTGSNAFREAVLVEFPHEGCWSIGFLTSPAAHVLGCGLEEDSVFCFIPMTPNPTSGFIVAVSKSKVKPLGMSVQDAFTLILSAGLIKPPGFTSVVLKKKP